MCLVWWKGKNGSEMGHKIIRNPSPWAYLCAKKEWMEKGFPYMSEEIINKIGSQKRWDSMWYR